MTGALRPRYAMRHFVEGRRIGRGRQRVERVPFDLVEVSRHRDVRQDHLGYNGGAPPRHRGGTPGGGWRHPPRLIAGPTCTNVAACSPASCPLQREVRHAFPTETGRGRRFARVALPRLPGRSAGSPGCGCGGDGRAGRRRQGGAAATASSATAGSSCTSKGRRRRSATSTATCCPPKSRICCASSKPFLLETTKKDWAFYRDVAEKILWPGIDEEYRAELDGIVAGLAARGVTADRWDIVALNALEELPDYYVPWLDKQQGKPPVGKAPGNCSAFIATGDWTKDQRIVIGHNAWTNYITGERWNIIFDIKPAKGHRILMDGLPGIIASDDDFGVNDAGIVITETTITGFEGFDPDGTPEFYRARKAMQYAESIDDYVRIMVDRQQRRLRERLAGRRQQDRRDRALRARAEELDRGRTKNGYFVGANFPVKAKLMKEETTFDPTNKASSPNARRARWEQLMAQAQGRRSTSSWRRRSRPTSTT